ncbi:MAG: metallophosphoesterase [Paludisphaera borealis]|uniref:metallophosphoesterase family protein n=1 Tax=Paludisphaera borealis TaxID=1387353 RepID=UPI00283F4BCE|nr:metallophosphoesterase [Paludisphaera borealis]MDR3621377.1 metallophosphoesterase [Paludisphaera borealis]
MPPIRLVHISDVHVWRYTINPAQLFNKRLLGMSALLVRRARKFRLERLAHVVDRVVTLKPDHILVSGDLTTTALPIEFQAAREALAPWLGDPSRATVIPGNHDRYTGAAARDRHFEQTFGEFAGAADYPWIRPLDDRTSILGLDPTRAGWSARGTLPASQLEAAKTLWNERRRPGDRLIVACHYPLDAPEPFRDELHPKRMTNAGEVGRWLSNVGPHLYCCGHVHRAWAFGPPEIPDQLCLNAGAPLLRDPSGANPPGFLEIVLDDADVHVDHHYWNGHDWGTRPLVHRPGFFDRRGF